MAGQISDSQAAELLRNMRLAAPEVDGDLVELLARWTERGRTSSAKASTWPIYGPVYV